MHSVYITDNMEKIMCAGSFQWSWFTFMCLEPTRVPDLSLCTSCGEAQMMSEMNHVHAANEDHFTWSEIKLILLDPPK